MKKPPAYWNKAKRILSKRDSVLRKIINKFNKGYLTSRKDPFFSLCRTIIGQQISTKAADSIWLKFEMKCKKKIVPKTVLKLTSSSLKTVGLSRQKITYLKNIAKSFNNKSFNIKDLQKMNDEQAITYITQLKGLGVWSAQMFLMFNLNRPDVFPATDLGVQKGFQIFHDLDDLPEPSFMIKKAKIWKPYRTLAAHYMWRLVEGPFEW